MKKYFSILILIKIILVQAYASEHEIKTITAKDLYENYLNNSSYQLIDNRPKEKFTAGHIRGAINLTYHSEGSPENVLNQKLLTEITKKKKIIFYCTGFERAYHASKIAITKWKIPKDRIIWFKGGMIEWIQAGYP